MSTAQLVIDLKAENQDFEFYPTTDEIIAVLMRRVRGDCMNSGRHYGRTFDSVLDIGAGNGKVLRAFAEQAEIKNLYAIEKSALLCQQLPPDVFIVGSDFHEQSLVSKQIDLTYCNPPYSEFAEWAYKVIRESASRFVYLLLPMRWADSQVIKEALHYRNARANVIGSFDFMESEDRQARGFVNLIQIELPESKCDAFDRFFDEQFAELKANFAKSENKPADDGEAPAGGIPSPSDEAPGPDFPDRQVALYNAAVDEMQRNYQALSKMNVSLLMEFGVWPAEVLKRLKEKSTKLRDIYWSHLFGKLSAVTNRLTKKKRDALLRTLNRNGHVDFTVGNIHAVLIYVLKNANQFLDEQLIEVTERMIEKANVRNYKSNDRVFAHDRWRYAEEKPTHIALEYRIVLGWCGGIRRGYSLEKGLDDTAREFIGDLMTVARNLGFDCDTQHPELNEPLCREWESGDKKIITCKYAGKTETLLEVRAFLNRNLHIRMNQRFALALNVEFGRLKGWLHSAREASEELGDQNAAKHFRSHLQLGGAQLPMLLGSAPAAAA